MRNDMSAKILFTVEIMNLRTVWGLTINHGITAGQTKANIIHQIYLKDRSNSPNFAQNIEFLYDLILAERQLDARSKENLLDFSRRHAEIEKIRQQEKKQVFIFCASVAAVLLVSWWISAANNRS